MIPKQSNPLNIRNYRRSRSRPKDISLLCIRVIIFGFYATSASLCIPIIYHMGIHLPLIYINLALWPLISAVSALACIIYIRSGQHLALLKRSHLIKLKAWFFVVLALCLYAFLRKTPLDNVTREAIAFCYIGIFLLLGCDDRFWKAAIYHLTIIFYTGAFLIFLFYRVEMPWTSALANTDFNELNGRFTNSIGYSLRPLIASGLTLGMLGLVNMKKGVAAFLSLLPLLIFFVINAGIFQFRSTFVILAVMICSYLLIRPVLERRARPGTSTIIIITVLLTAGLFTTTETFRLISERRILNNGQLVVFESRQLELNEYISDIGYGALVGRGMGGTYDATAVYGDKGIEWSVLHFGILGFTLKGGVVCLLVFASFLWPGFIIRNPRWYKDPYNLTAALLFPILLIQFILNPISFTPGMIILYASQMMVIARFGKRISYT